MAGKDYSQLAAAVIEAIGGRENVRSVTHCMTRLRFDLVDKDKVSPDLEKIEGVVKVVRAGGQTQVVIGTMVDKVYDEVVRIGHFEATEKIQENLDEQPPEKKKFSAKELFGRAVDGLTGSLMPVLPAYVVGGIFKMIVTLLGPSYMDVLKDGSDLLVLFTLVGDACYYFAPIFTAWSASRKFGCSTILSLVIAGIMIHPTMLGIVEQGEAFTVFGIPMRLVNYTQAVIPIVLTVWAQSVVEKWVKKIIPDIVRTMAVPVLTILIMLPIALCAFGPVCYYLMSGLADLILWMSDTIGIFAMAVIGATWTFITMFGMHVPILTIVLPAAMAIGYDPVVFPASIAAGLAGLGVSLGYALKVKSKEEKVMAWEYFVTMVTANIGEPFLYGVVLQNWKVLAYQTIGGAIGGILMGIMHARVFTFSGVGFPFLNPIRFGEDVVQAAICCAIAFAIPVVLSLIFGVNVNKKEKTPAQTKSE